MHRLTITILLLSVLSGCGHAQKFLYGTPEPEPELTIANDYERSRLIALDMVNTLVQIPDLDPSDLVLFADQPVNQFGRILFSVLQDAGYDLRIGVQSESDRLLYDIVQDAAVPASVAADTGVELEALYTFYIAANDVKVKRQYRTNAVGVWPVSAMFVHGADVAEIAVNDELFDDEFDASSDGNSLKSDEALIASIGNDQSAQATSAIAALNADTDFKEVVSRDRENMFDRRSSNFQDVFSSYSTVREERLIFPNDSLVMGAQNKLLARQIAENFDPKVDVISVIGCSHGKSTLVDGNSILANGRAARVKEELILAGVTAEQVLEEGCWAAEHFDKFPRRGVVLSHKRKDS